jgi:hypothetical protein
VRRNEQLRSLLIERQGSDLDEVPSLKPVPHLTRGHCRKVLEIVARRYPTSEDYRLRNDFTIALAIAQARTLFTERDSAPLQNVTHRLDDPFSLHSQCVRIIERLFNFWSVELNLRARSNRQTNKHDSRQNKIPDPHVLTIIHFRTPFSLRLKLK